MDLKLDRLDLERAGYIGDRVVALRRFAGRRDRVFPDILTVFTAQRVGDLIIADQPFDRRRQFRISRRIVVVDLGLVVRSHCHGLRRDRQRARRRRVFIVRIRRLYKVRDCPNIQNARYRIAPGLTIVNAVLNRRAFRHARRRSAFVHHCVIFAAVVHCRYRHLCLRDRQFAGSFIPNGIELGNIVTFRIHDHECRTVKGTIRIGSNILAGGRRISGNRQYMSVRKAFYLILGFIDRCAGSGDRFGKRVTILRLAVIGLGLVLNGDRQRRRGDRQGAEVFGGDFIVRLFCSIPSDRIPVGCRTDRRLAAGCGDRCGFTVYKPIDRCLCIRQRRAVIDLLAAARRDGKRRRHDLQRAFTCRDRNVKVRIIRQREQSSDRLPRYFIGIVVAFRTCVGLRQTFDRLPIQASEDRFQIQFAVLRIRDIDVVRKRLTGICEARCALGSVIYVARPTVGFNNDNDGCFRNDKRTGDIFNMIVFVRTFMGNDRMLRRGVAVAYVNLFTVVGNCRQRIAGFQPDNRHITETVALERGSVIVLAQVFRSDRQVLLIGQRNRDVPCFIDVEYGRVCAVAEQRIARKLGADRFDRTDGKRLGLRILDRIAVHIHVVHGELHRVIRDVVEGQNILRFILTEGQNQRGLFRAVGLRKLLRRCAGILHNGLVDRLCHFGNAAGCTVHRNVLIFRNMNGGIILQHILNNICVFGILFAVDELDLIVFIVQRTALGCAVRQEARNGNRLFGHNLTDREQFAFHRLGREDVAFLAVDNTHIADRILQRNHAPVRIEINIFRDLACADDITVAADRLGKPAEEGIVRTFRIGYRFRVLVLIHRLLRIRFGCVRIVVVERNREGLRNPLCVKFQI